MSTSGKSARASTKDATSEADVSTSDKPAHVSMEDVAALNATPEVDASTSDHPPRVRMSEGERLDREMRNRTHPQRIDEE